MKRCTKCGEEKPLDAFRFRSKRRGWRQSWCKSCSSTNTRTWQQANPEKVTTAKVRHHLMNRYGITPEERDALFAGGCAYCGGTDWLNVDHDHEKTIGDDGFVRGALCSVHNRALGILGDNEAGLLKMVAYLRGEL